MNPSKEMSSIYTNLNEYRNVIHKWASIVVNTFADDELKVGAEFLFQRSKIWVYEEIIKLHKSEVINITFFKEKNFILLCIADLESLIIIMLNDCKSKKKQF